MLNRAALLEVGILFLPGIPAYIWIWPNLSAAQIEIFQVIVYIYILLGTVFISRHWRWTEVGINRLGMGLVLVCGLVILAGRLLIILSIDWSVHPPPLTWSSLAWKVFFYIVLVGLVEELFF